jgi:PAS domain S-box-containing protein
MNRQSLVAEVAQGISAATGQAYFRVLVESLAKALEVDHVFIGELLSAQGERVQTLAVHVRGRPAQNFVYDLAGTPCANVVDSAICVYPAGARERFPGDVLLGKLGIESYAGVPLFDARRRCLGLLAVMASGPMERPERVETALRLFAPRAAAELERKQVEDSLRKSEEFHRLISELASDYAYDCRVDPDGSATMQAITDGFIRVTGYTLAEIQSLGGWPHLIHPDDLPGALSRQREILETPGFQELRILTKQGDVRWIRYSTRPVFDPVEGRVTRLVGAVQDITERKHNEGKLQAYAQSLQFLSRRLLEVQEQERRHLARELHDEIGQVLTGLKLSLEMAGRVPATEIPQTLAGAQRLVQDLTSRVRDLSSRLRPAMLDDLGLLPALLWHVDRYTGQTRVHVHLEHHGLDRRLHPDVETAAFRIVQEALTNIARHAGVSEARVRIRRERDVLHLEIADRGRGFDVKSVLALGMTGGLPGIHERVRLLGGRLDFNSDPGRGTCISITLPAETHGVAAPGAEQQE